jgi:hypothetical protein
MYESIPTAIIPPPQANAREFDFSKSKSCSSTFIYTKHFARPLANFAPVISQNKRGLMPDGVGMFSCQIPAYAELTSGQIPGVRLGDNRSWI